MEKRKQQEVEPYEVAIFYKLGMVASGSFIWFDADCSKQDGEAAATFNIPQSTSSSSCPM